MIGNYGAMDIYSKVNEYSRIKVNFVTLYPDGNIAMTGLIVIPLILCCITLVPGARADEALVMERLMTLAAGLQEIGDEMVGDPVSGSLIVGDTVSHSITFISEFKYYIHILTDSYFNVADFWLENSSGSTMRTVLGDNALLMAIPDTTETWTLKLLLREGAYSDTAYYAAAILRSARYLN